MPKKGKGDVAGQKRRWEARNRDRLNAKQRARAAERRRLAGVTPRPPRLARPTKPPQLDKRVFYIVGYGHNIAPCKFGITTDVDSMRPRLRRLQCGNPNRLSVFVAETINGDFCGARQIESVFLRMTKHLRCSGGREWVNCTPLAANEILRTVLHRELVLNNPYLPKQWAG
jgi:hypothetical protein